MGFCLGAGLTIIPLELQATVFHPRLAILQRLDFTNKTRPWSALLSEVEKAAEAYAITTLTISDSAPPSTKSAVSAKARALLAELSLEFTSDAFVGAAIQNDQYAIGLFISAGMDPNATNDVGSTALIEATCYNKLEMVVLLLSIEGIDPGFIGRTRYVLTALDWAIDAGSDIAIIKALLQAGVNGCDNNALRRSVSKGNEVALRVLLEHGENKESIGRAFIAAACDGNINFLNILQQYGGGIECVGENALIMVLSSGRNSARTLVSDGTIRAVIFYLVKLGVDVNYKNEDGFTPLLYAMWISYFETAEVLLELGADVKAYTNDGRTALHFMCANYIQGHDCCYAVGEVLIAKGADVNAMSDIQTPLISAAYKNDRVDLVAILLQAGADVNHKNKRGHTALMIAASHNNSNIVMLLTSAGARVDEQDFYGNTALDFVNFGTKPEDVQRTLGLSTNCKPLDNEVTRLLLGATAQKLPVLES